MFAASIPSKEILWRSIILFGKNVATYKFALGKSLLDLAENEIGFIGLSDLAVPFSKHICDHLLLADKQGTSQNSRFLNACRDYNAGRISKDELISTTTSLGFNNVIDAFHRVGGGDIQNRFFIDERKSRKGITITDDLFELKNKIQFSNFPFEVEARWRLVETAWSLNINPNLLEAKHDKDNRIIFLEGKDSRRIDVTSSRDSLNGYQEGKCFYCSREMTLKNSDPEHSHDVDHFFPFVLKYILKHPNLNIDGVWNLVLCCRNCNRGTGGKFDRIPEIHLLEKLQRRNEYLIQSHHPLRETIINQTGNSEELRINFLKEVDKFAISCRPFRWRPPHV